MGYMTMEQIPTVGRVENIGSRALEVAHSICAKGIDRLRALAPKVFDKVGEAAFSFAELSPDGGRSIAEYARTSGPEQIKAFVRGE